MGGSSWFEWVSSFGIWVEKNYIFMGDWAKRTESNDGELDWKWPSAILKRHENGICILHWAVSEGKERVNCEHLLFVSFGWGKKRQGHSIFLLFYIFSSFNLFEQILVEMCENQKRDVSKLHVTNPRLLLRIHTESECVWGGGGCLLSQFLWPSDAQADCGVAWGSLLTKC